MFAPAARRRLRSRHLVVPSREGWWRAAFSADAFPSPFRRGWDFCYAPCGSQHPPRRPAARPRGVRQRRARAGPQRADRVPGRRRSHRDARGARPPRRVAVSLLHRDTVRAGRGRPPRGAHHVVRLPRRRACRAECGRRPQPQRRSRGGAAARSRGTVSVGAGRDRRRPADPPRHRGGAVAPGSPGRCRPRRACPGPRPGRLGARRLARGRDRHIPRHAAAPRHHPIGLCGVGQSADRDRGGELPRRAGAARRRQQCVPRSRQRLGGGVARDAGGARSRRPGRARRQHHGAGLRCAAGMADRPRGAPAPFRLPRGIAVRTSQSPHARSCGAAR